MFFKTLCILLLLVTLVIVFVTLSFLQGIEERQQVSQKCCQKNALALEEHRLFMKEFYDLFIEYPDDSKQFKEEHKKMLQRLGRLLGMFCR